MDFGKIQRLTAEEFAKFSKLVYDESGIFMKEAKITLLSNRLRKRLSELKIETFSEYYEYINNLKDKHVEIEALLDVVSTNETYFFRNERHFEALSKKCFQDIAERKKDRKLRIWSAGCSTGEEPYTISICVNEQMSLFKGWDIEILATDIAYSVMEFAKIGRYSGRRIEKVPPDLLKKYFKQVPGVDDVLEITDDVRKLVKFKPLNLFKDSFPADVDIIFCRNVMIYFDKEHQKLLVSNFYKSINKSDGYFFIGHSETLHSVSDDFIYVKILDAPIYIPKERKNEFSNR
ncbi:MAG: protein-glutamate O-methyltransferase CheR [Spirochaetes bacterium]|nr:protein-glutamate O-methyltransferase CheR [Spirochaetota bacterium]